MEGVQGEGRVVRGGGGGWRVDNAYWVEDQGKEGGRVEMKGGRRIVGGGLRDGGWR